MNKPMPTECRNCGSTELTWFCCPLNKGGVADGRIRMSEVSVVFSLGCDHCSETLAQLSDDKFMERFAAAETKLITLMECFGRDGTYLKREPDEADKASEQVVYRGKTTWDWWAKAHAYGSMVHGINPILGVREGEMTVDAARRAVAERDASRNRQVRDVRDMHAAYEQRDALRGILTRSLQALPVGNIQTHTAESLPGRIDELVKRYAETDKLEAERDEALAKLAASEAKHKGKE